MSTTMMRMIGVILAGGLMFGLAGCGSTTIKRVNTDTVQDLSGNWNDTDSRLVSSRMVSDLLSQKWLKKFQRRNEHNPVVIVGEIRNLSHEHINTRTFVSDLERELINSGEVEFVASSNEREEVRAERADQEMNASVASVKPTGEETGADFMLKGQINTIFDAANKTQVKYYQVDLTLISLKDNRKIWVGQKKIKKIIEKNMFR